MSTDERTESRSEGLEGDTLHASVEIDRALAAWTPLAPPADFADRVVAAREAPPARPRRARWIGGVAVVAAAAAAAVLLLRSPYRVVSGSLVALERTSQLLGARGTAVAEPAAELAWRIDGSGAADIIQRAGNVFYRVERGGPFVVHTAAGDVRVTGTCFRIEVDPMNTTQKMLLSGVAGAALATTVLVTVYEGHVVAETRSGRTELAAGSSATLGGSAPGGAAPANEAAVAVPLDDTHASREQLVLRTRMQQDLLVKLRARVAQLENAKHTAAAEPAADDGGRPWHDPSPEQLAEFATHCHVRADDPSLERFTPLRGPDTGRGMLASEVDDYNAAMTEMAKQWKDVVHGLYLEVTGDTAGADTLSVDAMTRELQDKSPQGERPQVLQRLARERAGIEPPPRDSSKASPLERYWRAFVQLGDQSEAALARRIGAERAHAIRGDGWGARSDSSECPSHPAGAGH